MTDKKNEYTACSTYATAGNLTTDDTGNYTHNPHNYDKCIGCQHTECPYWRPPCHKKHRYYPPYHPWWPYYPYPYWEPYYPYPNWTTTTITWTAT